MITFLEISPMISAPIHLPQGEAWHSKPGCRSILGRTLRKRHALMLEEVDSGGGLVDCIEGVAWFGGVGFILRKWLLMVVLGLSSQKMAFIWLDLAGLCRSLHEENCLLGV